MITIGWPAAIVFLMGYYWPVALMLAITLTACIFICTKKMTWRISGVILAVIIMSPAIWFFWISLTI